MGENLNAVPRRRYEMELKLNADSWVELLEALRIIRIEMNSEPTNGGELEKDYHKSQLSDHWTARCHVDFDHNATYRSYFDALSNRLKALDRLMDEAEAMGNGDTPAAPADAKEDATP